MTHVIEVDDARLGLARRMGDPQGPQDTLRYAGERDGGWQAGRKALRANSRSWAELMVPSTILHEHGFLTVAPLP